MKITVQKKSVQNNLAENTTKDRLDIGKVAVSLSAIAIFSKVFGFAEKLIMAHFFGTGTQADVYFASMGIILPVVFLVKELINPSVLPIFAQTLKISVFASSDLFRKIFFRLLAMLTVFAVIAILFSDVITDILMLGFSEDKKLLTSSFLKFLMPGCFFMCLMTFTQSVLNCRKDFLKAAVPETCFKLFIAAGLLVFIPIIDIYALAVVVLIGSILAFIIQFIFIPESKAILAYSVYSANCEYERVLKLMGPLVLGVVFSHINGLVDNMLASTLPTGQLSFLGYSKKLIDAILLVGPVALVTVVYSQLSHFCAEDKFQEFKALFVKTLKLILFVSVPVAIVLLLLSEPLVTVLFERGNFTSQSTLGTSQALFIYGIGLITFSLESLLVYSFYALSNTKTPVIAGVFTVLIDIFMAIFFVGSFGFIAIAWAFVISKTIKILILLLIMERKFKFMCDGDLGIFVVKLLCISLFSAFVLYILKYMSFTYKEIFKLVFPAAGFVLIFICCCRLLRMEEFNDLSAIILRKKNFGYQLAGDKP